MEEDKGKYMKKQFAIEILKSELEKCKISQKTLTEESDEFINLNQRIESLDNAIRVLENQTLSDSERKTFIEMPCNIGDIIYEIVIDDIGNEVYFEQYTVQDVSVKAIMYCDYWKNRDRLGKNIFLDKEKAHKIFKDIMCSEEFRGYKFFYYDKEMTKCDWERACIMNNIKVKLRLPDCINLLKYGEIVSDQKSYFKSEYRRIMKIRYMGILYHLHLLNGEVKSLKQWDNFAYQEDQGDIHALTDHELADMLMFSDRDRKENKDAERVYWLCIKEINKRSDSGKWDN